MGIRDITPLILNLGATGGEHQCLAAVTFDEILRFTCYQI